MVVGLPRRILVSLRSVIEEEKKGGRPPVAGLRPVCALADLHTNHCPKEETWTACM